MVLSNIDSNVSYPELKRANPEDADMETDVYVLSIKNVEVVVALGNSRDDFKKKDIVYFPIYLVKSNNKVVQIGVFEVENSKLPSYLDQNGDLDLEKASDPLVYNFATKAFLEKRRMLPPEEHDPSEEAVRVVENEDEMEIQGTTLTKDVTEKKTLKTDDMTIPDDRADIFILTKGVQVPAMLNEESKQQSKDIREKYKDTPSDIWVSKYMKNPHYNLVNNEGGGDCLFATIRDAFSQIGQQTSVAKIRKKLADEATDQVFSGYKEQYDMYNNALINESSKIKELSKSYVSIKDKFSNVLDRNEQKILVENAKQVKGQHDKIIGEKKITAAILGEFKFMKDVDTLEKFKKKIQTCDFWGETWSISTLERALNIKFVLLSNEAYASKDFDNVLNCGQLNDTILQNKGYFSPDYYIIVEYNGSHYQLVSYKDKQIFTFPEIPYDIKKLIVDKCLERNSGPFSLIKEFTDMKKKISPVENKSDMQIDVEDLTEARLHGMYTEDIVLSFYAKSASKPLPGKGSGEKIPKDFVKEFSELATIPEWRKKLANTWSMNPFTLDNHKWSSVEHYYQGSKFKKDNPEFYLSFSIDSGTELSESVDMALAAGSKSGKYKGTLLRPKQVNVDPDFFGERTTKEMRDAQYAKFSQNPDLKKALLLTKNAKLIEHKRGRQPEVYETLMLIRETFNNEQDE
jgi:hypothetical protein